MIVLFLLLVVAVGILSGIIGIGGGIVIVPALVYFLHMSQHKAQGTSLAVLLAPIGILAVWKYSQAGNIDMKAAIFIAIGFTAGAYFGGAWAQHIPDAALKKVFGVVLLLVGLRMLLQKT